MDGLLEDLWWQYHNLDDNPVGMPKYQGEIEMPHNSMFCGYPEEPCSCDVSKTSPASNPLTDEPMERQGKWVNDPNHPKYMKWVNEAKQKKPEFEVAIKLKDKNMLEVINEKLDKICRTLGI